MRIPSMDTNGLKKGTWSLEEDQKLIAYITRYRIWNWCLMPKFAGLSRSGKSCRLRWLNYLSPDIKRGNITKEEEEIIMNMYTKFGSRWSKIAARLPGRTDNEIKNYWHTHLRKRLNKKTVTKGAEIQCQKALVEDSYKSVITTSVTSSEVWKSEGSNYLSGTPYLMQSHKAPVGYSYESKITPSVTSSEVWNSEGSNYLSRTPCLFTYECTLSSSSSLTVNDTYQIDKGNTDSLEANEDLFSFWTACSLSSNSSLIVNINDYQIDEENTTSSLEVDEDLFSLWTQRFSCDDLDMVNEQELDIPSLYQEPLSPCNFYNNEYCFSHLL